MKKTFGCLLVAVAFLSKAYSQTDTLPHVEVQDKALDFMETYRFTESPDSLLRQATQGMPVSSSLEYATLHPIRNYGPGGIATISMNGLSSNHSPMRFGANTWQDGQLGTTDYSILPSYLLGNIMVGSGGDGAAAGSGGAGGWVKPNPFPLGKEIFIQGSSLENYALGGAYGITSGSSSLGVRVFGRQEQNSFEQADSDVDLPDATQLAGGRIYATTNYKGYHLTSDILSVFADRQVPNASQQQRYSAQRDHQTGIHLGVRKRLGNWEISSISGLLHTFLHFEDTNSNINSVNNGFQANQQVAASYWVHEKLRIGSRIGSRIVSARNNNYGEFVSEWQSFALASASYWPTKKLSMEGTLRQTWWQAQTVPLIPSFHAGYQIHSKLKITGSVSRLFRMPTLNDRFWPGVEEEIVHEEGWHQEIGLRFEHAAKSLRLQTHLSGFHNELSNAIIWLPNEEGRWVPGNYQFVENYGIKSSATIRFKKPIMEISLTGGYAYLLSNTLENEQKYQSLFIPPETARLQANIITKWGAIMYAHKWTSWQFISKDESDFLEAYQAALLQIGKSFGLKKEQSLSTNFLVNNIWNNAYQAVPGRWMPPRNFQLQFNYNFN